MISKKYAALILAASLALASCSSGPPASKTSEENPVESTTAETSDVLYLTIASSALWSDSITGQVLSRYQEKLKEWSGGTMEIILYEGSSLGGDDELIPGAVQGTLSIVNSVSSVHAKVVPEATLLGIPGFFQDYDTYNRLMESDYFDVLHEYYAREGLELMAAFANSYRELTCDRPIRSVEDLAGVKIRTLNNPYHMAFWDSLGCDASYLPFGDLYMALRKGDFQAQENPLSAVERNHFNEVQKYVIFTHHVVVDYMFVMNQAQYNALTEEQKGWLKRFFAEIKKDLIDESPEDHERLKRLLEESCGMEMLYPDETFMAEMQKGTELVIGQLRQELGTEKVDLFLSAVDAVAK
ncbi:TRAP transporter substrate-binding protein [Hominifimenecus sp. rT4P-3]|uniref:TRAP transporter substrate-binding protein n=1 Tax=Hominifimenecus sp. rT4P-3 TaxID=3242979 RepID=UPI003DA6816C